MGRPILFLLRGRLLRGLLAAIVCVCPATPSLAQTSLCCPADLDGDGAVGPADLALVLDGWGTPQGDVDGDGATGPSDLALLLGAWGTCATEPCLLTRVVGRVVFEDGAPAASAVIVTNEGGKGVSGADGSFSFDIEVSKGTADLQVTAIASVRGVTYAGTTLASPIVLGGVTDAGEIVVVADAACEPSWLPTFGGAPGVNSDLVDFAIFDDGGGPALYAVGRFTSAGGVVANRVAKWDGAVWSPLGSGLNGDAWAVETFDSGSGAALYVGGQFSMAGGVFANRLARWDGHSWSAVGPMLNGGVVYALAACDDCDAGGPALYVGGSFTHAGATLVNRVARWNGTSWSALGTGMNSTVLSLARHERDGRAALYAGGQFTIAGGASASRVAVWDGGSWAPLGTGTNSSVWALASFDDGSGNGRELYAGGLFSVAGGRSVGGIAKWDGASWLPLGEGVNGFVYAILPLDAGGGGASELVVAGAFTTAGGAPANRIARWDGTSWTPIGEGMNATVVAVAAVSDPDSGRVTLYAGGSFTVADGHFVNCFATSDGSSWTAAGEGITGGFTQGLGVAASIQAMTTFEDGFGSGRQLVVGGILVAAGGVATSNIAAWNGATWRAFGSGLDGPVYALAVFDDGSGRGPELYVGGTFTIAGGVAANRIAKWDGRTWAPVGAGVSGTGPGLGVFALEVFDDGQGGGPALYAAGRFTVAGDVAASHVAKWDGESWSPLGAGIGGVGPSFGPAVWTLEVFDDASGRGPSLVAGGPFTTAGGRSAQRIARWDGAAWHALEGGVNGFVWSLHAFDDASGGGPALYVGGNFVDASGVPALRVARWDGEHWHPLGGGLGFTVFALTSFDDGSGPALYATGEFTGAGGFPASRIERWDGSSWNALGGQFNGPASSLGVFAPADSGKAALYVGGGFFASPAGDSFLAKWGCADEPPPDGGR